jgi:hypothetical protein
VDQRAAAKAAAERINNKANEIADAGVKEFKDFGEARATLLSAYGDKIQSNPAFLEAMVDTPAAHKVFYHLGKNPEVAEKILNMAPIPMAMEIARLGDKFAKPEEIQVSRAPAPIGGKVNGSVKAELDPDDPEMPIDQWMAWREADLRKRGLA